VRLQIFDVRPYGVVLREAVMRPHPHPGQSEKERNSGARVPKVEVTRQYKLAFGFQKLVHGGLARAGNRGEWQQGLGGAPTL
jgi:hypothetical protein